MGGGQEVQRVQWQSGEDFWWLEEIGPREEQAWQGRGKVLVCPWQESLQAHQGLDRCLPEGTQGARHQGLRGHQEGHTVLQGSQGPLQCLSWHSLTLLRDDIMASCPIAVR